MLNIKKTGEDYYLVNMRAGMDLLNKLECDHLKHQVTHIIKPHREIPINITGVRIIDNWKKGSFRN